MKFSDHEKLIDAIDTKDDKVLKRRIYAAKLLAKGYSRLNVMHDLEETFGISRNSSRADLKHAVEKILPATHSIGTIEQRISEGIARTEAHYDACMKAGNLGAATATLKLLISILGANADQAMARERLEMERTAVKLKELQLRQQQSKAAQEAFSDMSEAELFKHIEELKREIGGDEEDRSPSN